MFHLRRAPLLPLIFLLAASIAASACSSEANANIPTATATVGHVQLSVEPVEDECPPEFPDRVSPGRYGVQYSNEAHNVFTPVIRSVFADASVTCYLDLEDNRIAGMSLRYRFPELLPENAPFLIRDAFIAAGVPESSIETSPFERGGIRSADVVLKDLRYLGFWGEMEARVTIFGRGAFLSVQTHRMPCGGRQDEWSGDLPRDGSVANQIDSALRPALAEALGASLALGCATSGGLGGSSSHELRYTLEAVSISDAAAAIAGMVSDAGGTVAVDSPYPAFSEAKFGDWLLSGEIVYDSQPNIGGPVIRVSMIAEPS